MARLVMFIVIIINIFILEHVEKLNNVFMSPTSLTSFKVRNPTRGRLMQGSLIEHVCFMEF